MFHPRQRGTQNRKSSYVDFGASVPRWRGWSGASRAGGGLRTLEFGCGYAAPGYSRSPLTGLRTSQNGGLWGLGGYGAAWSLGGANLEPFGRPTVYESKTDYAPATEDGFSNSSVRIAADGYVRAPYENDHAGTRGPTPVNFSRQTPVCCANRWLGPGFSLNSRGQGRFQPLQVCLCISFPGASPFPIHYQMHSEESIRDLPCSSPAGILSVRTRCNSVPTDQDVRRDLPYLSEGGSRPCEKWGSCVV